MTLFQRFKAFTRSEKQGNAPYTRKCNHGINDPCEERILTATDPCNGIELEKTDAAPVECTYNCKNQSNSIDKHKYLLLILLDVNLPSSVFFSLRRFFIDVNYTNTKKFQPKNNI